MSDSLAPSFRVARERFATAADAAGALVSTFVHPDQVGPDTAELSIDVAELGRADAPATLLIMSGTHGVEGYAGSALQDRWLRKTDAGTLPTDVRVVLVHAFNPYGFAWHRRTNEDNVDLNRNFIDWSDGPPENPGYDELADLLVPEGWDEQTQASSTGALLEAAERLGDEHIQRAVTGGQYRHQNGLFYGGTGPVWSHRWLVEHAARLLGNSRRLGIIDLHTGLGPWGVGELIVHESRSHSGYERAESWWGDVRSMRDGESVSANLSGDWLGRIGALIPGVEITGAALEFGTVDAIQVLQALRAEAWVHGNADRESPEADLSRKGVRSVFVDEDPAWLAKLTERFDQVAAAAIDNLSSTT